MPPASFNGEKMKRNERYFLRSVGDTHFLVSSEEGDFGYIFLNETGAFLWKELAECGTVEELADRLMAVYNVERSTAMQDISEMLSFLKEKGCITEEG